MLREGHIGISLLALGVIGFPLLVLQAWEVYAVVAFGILATSTLPDIDQKTRLVKHRGWTHTVWFATFVGILFCFIVFTIATILPGLTILESITLGLVGGGAAAIGICLHIAGDVMTVQGIRFWTPVVPREAIEFDTTEKKYVLGWFKANNSTANIGFAIFGGAVLFTSVYVSIAAFS